MKLPRQQSRVLRLFVRGYTYKEIAAKLQISMASVSHHLHQVQKKAGIYGQQTVRLVRWAVNNGLAKL